MALKLDLAPGDAVRIGNSIIKVEDKSGKRTRVSIDSDEDIQSYKAGSKVPNRQALSRDRSSTQEKPKPAGPVLRRVPLSA
jgi:hypothetical protein